MAVENNISTTTDPVRMTKGTRVQVRNRFDGAWARGFEVYQSRRNGYLLRRLSDRHVLPTTFAAPELRQESAT